MPIQNTSATVLAVSERASSNGFKRLNRKYELAEHLDRSWALHPLELAHENGQTTLILEDPGGERVVGLQDLYWGRRKWMADNPQTMKMFLAALDEGLRAINAKPEAGGEAFARSTGMDPADALKILTLNKHVLVKDMREALEQPSLAFKPKPGEKYSGQFRFTKEMVDFLYQNRNITRELGLDEIAKATAPEYMEVYISSRPSAK